MTFKLLWNDFKKNKLPNGSIILFIMLSALLFTLAILLASNLSSSIDRLMTKAKTPDFLQMHKGDLDLEGLEAFAQDHPNVKDFQVLDYLNIPGDQVLLGDRSLKTSIQDLGLVYQSEQFDFLLDTENQPIQPKPGEVYLPLFFYKEGQVRPGDPVEIFGQDFRLGGFFRDSQMNASLAGSKRILLHQEDFHRLEDLGSPEYLIEFLLQDRGALAQFEKDFYDQVPEKNGPTITYPMFRMINGLTDGFLIGLLLLASFLILLISFLSIRLTLLAKLEDHYREMGLLKALGFRSGDIKKTYLAYLVFLSLLGLVPGFLLALLFQDRVLENIYLYMGTASQPLFPLLLSLLGLVLLFLVLLAYGNGILRQIKEISPVQALREGESVLAKGDKKNLSIQALGFQFPNLALALASLFRRKKQGVTLFLLVLLASFLMVMPQNIYHTFQDPSFITSMGIGQMDLRLDLEGDLLAQAQALKEALDQEEALAKWTPIWTQDVPLSLPNQEKTYLRTSFGDHGAFPIHYAQGQAPQKEDQIALSSLYMEDLGLSLGDKLVLESGQVLTLVGEYSDISNGGKTAKALFPVDLEGARLTTYLALKDPAESPQLMARYKAAFPGLKITSIQDYRDQALGPLLRDLGRLSLGLMGASLLVLTLISLLFTQLILAQERSQLAILQALGFRPRDLARQLAYRFLLVLFLALPLGIGLANSLGQVFAQAILASFGAKAVPFLINPWTSYLLIPATLVAVILLASQLARVKLAQTNIRDHIKES
ncbi:MAG: ABC transporter permease [Tissierellia bacterium]|nr:ABC transporter permease [Tissierellia bacterium]